MRSYVVAAVGWLALCACGSKAGLDAGATTATLEGQVCFAPPDPTRFLTKLVVLFDMGARNCVTDPPGSQSAPGVCEQVTVPPGVFQPARVKAMVALLDSLAARPDVVVSFLQYDSNVHGVWPPQGSFARPDVTLRNRVYSLQAELGTRSDLQGGLEFASALIRNDVLLTEQRLPELVPLTSYELLLVSGGPPIPRCAANDALTTWADDTHPDGTWPDTDPAFCNLADPNEVDPIFGFQAAGARNQTSDLVGIADDLVAFGIKHHVGRLGFQGVLQLNSDSLAACGAPCLDLYGQKFRVASGVKTPVAPTALPAFLGAEASALMTSLAQHFHGELASFSNGGIAQTSFASTDLSSLASDTVSKQLVVVPVRATPVQGAWVTDRDGDGTADSAEVAAGTNPDLADTDGDGFDDTFELRRHNEFFDPLVPDARGCDPASPATPNCTVRDADGDGLSNFAEVFLGTQLTLVDSDLDGFSDGLEVKWGLDPLAALGGEDSDLDGLLDSEELARGSDPLVADLSLPPISVTALEPLTRADGSVCQPFRATNVPLVDVAATPGVAPGANLVQLWSVAEPSKVHGFGEWAMGCAWVRRDTTQAPPVLVPADLTVHFNGGELLPPSQQVGTRYCYDPDGASKP